MFQRWNGRSLFILAGLEYAPDFYITSDAAGSIGFGAFCDSYWFAGEWPAGAADLSIAVKELIPIVISAFI